MELASPSLQLPPPTLRQDPPSGRPAPSLLFSTAPFFLRPTHEAFAAAAAAGFEGVEVMATRDPASQDPQALAELAATYDLRIGALHAPFLALTRSVFTSNPITKVVRTVAMAADLDVPTVIAHPPYRWQRDYRAWLDGELLVLQARTGVTVAVENMYPLLTRPLHRHCTLDELSTYPDITLDTSHAAVSGIDLTQAARHGGLRHVHLSDNRGRGWDSHALVGEGELPIDAFLDSLATARFDGAISLELDLRRWLKDPAALTTVLRTQRERCERMLPAPRGQW